MTFIEAQQTVKFLVYACGTELAQEAYGLIEIEIAKLEAENQQLQNTSSNSE